MKESQVDESQIDALAADVITLASKVGMRDENAAEANIPRDETTAALLHEIVAEEFVLLKNNQNLLPILPAKALKIAVFGSPAMTPVINGGGSSLTPVHVSIPLEALEEEFGKDNIQYHAGVPIFKEIPSAPTSMMRTLRDGWPGVNCYWYNGWTVGANQVHHEVLESTRTLVIDARISELSATHYTRMSFIMTPKTRGTHAFGVTACGKCVLRVDGKVILEHAGFEDCRVEYVRQPGDFEARTGLQMIAGREYHVTVDTLSTTAPVPSPIFKITPQATQVGFYEDLDGAIDKEAVTLAAQSDVSIIFTANNK